MKSVRMVYCFFQIAIRLLLRHKAATAKTKTI